MTIITNQDDLHAENVTMKDLVETWNALCPDKPVTRFSSVEAGRSRCANAILSSQNASGHAGVAKGAKPEVGLTTTTTTTTEGDDDMSKAASNPKAKAPKAKAPKAKAPKAKAPKAKAPKAAAAGRRAVYERVRLTEPDTPRRPHETSQRFKVLTALRKRKQCTVAQLSDDVGFNARPFVHKLAAVGWCEVMPAEEGK